MPNTSCGWAFFRLSFFKKQNSDFCSKATSNSTEWTTFSRALCSHSNQLINSPVASVPSLSSSSVQSRPRTKQSTLPYAPLPARPPFSEIQSPRSNITVNEASGWEEASPNDTNPSFFASERRKGKIPVCLVDESNGSGMYMFAVFCYGCTSDGSTGNLSDSGGTTLDTELADYCSTPPPRSKQYVDLLDWWKLGSFFL
jgi:hypothetical protein